MTAARAPLLALVLIAASVAEQLTGDRERIGLQVAIAVAFVAPIALRARLPWLAGVVQAALLVVLGLLGLEPDVIGEVLALLAAAYTAGALLDRTASGRVLIAMAVGGAANTTLLGSPEDIVWLVTVFVAPPWAAGRLMRARRAEVARLESLNAQLAAERDRTARLTAEAERVRIAADIRAALVAGLDSLTSRAEQLAAAATPPTSEGFSELRAEGAAITAELRRLLGLLP